MLSLDPERDVEQWLADNSHPLTSVEAGAPDEDLDAFLEMVGDARIVGAGEPTHGNREIVQLRHRLLEKLVREKGFSLFGLEAPVAEAERLNAYVVDGQGTAEEALAAITMWAWDTREYAAMLDWMRAWNANPEKSHTIEVFGFDNQSTERATRLILEALEKVDAPLAAIARRDLGVLAVPLNDPEAGGYRPVNSAEVDEQALFTARRVVRSFDDNRIAYQSILGRAEWERHRQYAQNLAWLIEGAGGHGLSYDNARDLAQAANVRWQLERRGDEAKAFIWAHNVHLANGDRHRGQDYKTAGHHLKRWYGDDYFVIASLFYEGDITAIDAAPWGHVRVFDAGTAGPGFLETIWEATGASLAMVDLRDLPVTGPVHEWFASRQLTRHSGGGWSDGGYRLSSLDYFLPEAFDALAFVRETTPTRTISPSDYALDPPLAEPTNLDFEQQEPDYPSAWLVWSKQARWGYSVDLVGDPGTGNRHARLCGIAKPLNEDTGGSLIQYVDAAPYRGKGLTFSAQTRAQIDGDTRAYLRLRVEPDPSDDAHYSGENLYDSADQFTVLGDNWRRQEIVAQIPENAGYLAFGLLLDGEGCVDIDDVELNASEL